jgi:hypothetical protein
MVIHADVRPAAGGVTMPALAPFSEAKLDPPSRYLLT